MRPPSPPSQHENTQVCHIAKGIEWLKRHLMYKEVIGIKRDDAAERIPRLEEGPVVSRQESV